MLRTFSFFLNVQGSRTLSQFASWITQKTPITRRLTQQAGTLDEATRLKKIQTHIETSGLKINDILKRGRGPKIDIARSLKMEYNQVCEDLLKIAKQMSGK